MKNLILSLAALVSFTAFAQEAPKTIYEKQGALVKTTVFHDNGTVAQIGTFLNGKLDGKWVMFTPKGEKLAMGNYKLGTKTGKWFFWEGTTMKEVDFIDNRMVAVTQWNNKGAVVLNN